MKFNNNVTMLLDNILEHKMFKPLAIAIIATFIIFNFVNYLTNFIKDETQTTIEIEERPALKVNITDQTGSDIKVSQTMQHKIRSGDTLLQILVSAGISDSEILQILTAIRKEFNPTLVNIGHKVVLDYNIKIEYNPQQEQKNVSRQAIIDKIRIIFSPEVELLVEKDANGNYKAKTVKHPLDKKVLRYSGTVENSLFVDGVSLGISPTTMMNMINLYSYDVDFQRDIQKNNSFEILIESFYTKDGKKVRDGEILFSSLKLSNRTIELYAFKVRGNTEYFNAKGESIRKSLLRTPINGARISSGFGLRKHPVLGYSRMHKGIDFAAPTGTPILAAGDGVIVYRGRLGGYGNYVKIKHNNEYSTAYAHASRFAKNFRVGSRVRQGNVVAYVGTTGRSTGPHLHYEILKNGNQINPRSVRTTSGVKLTGANLAEFKKSKEVIDEYLKTIPINSSN